MGVDYTTVAGFGFTVTYKEAANLARELNLLDEDELNLTDEDLCEEVPEIFDTKDLSCHTDAYDGAGLDNTFVIVDKTTLVDVSPGEIKTLDTTVPVNNKTLMGIAERLGREPSWVLYSYLW